MGFYKDKQSGEFFTAKEVLDMVDGVDQLGSFVYYETLPEGITIDPNRITDGE